MTPKRPCPRCGYMLSPHHYGRHLRVCERIPLDDELRKIAPTMTVTQMGNLWGVNHGSIRARLDRMGVTPGQDWRMIPPTWEQVAQMMELYDEGVPVQTIATMIDVVEGRTQRTVLRLLAEGKLTKREKPYTVPAVYDRCSECKIRLDGPGVPEGEGGRCGLCVGPEPPLEVLEASAPKLAMAMIDLAKYDARSGNGHRAAARWWLRVPVSDYWIDLLEVAPDFARERMAREGVL